MIKGIVNSGLLSAKSTYERAVSFAHTYFTPWQVDAIEMFGAPVIGITVGLFQLVFSKEKVSRNIFLSKKEWFAIGALSVAAYAVKQIFNKYIRSPYLQDQYKRIIEISKEKQSVMLVFYSNKTHAFELNHRQIGEFERLSKRYKLHVANFFSYENTQTFQQRINFYDQKFDRIDIMAHGSQDAIYLNNATVISHGSTTFFNWLNNHLIENGTIVLNSCCTGAGEENIAKTISTNCPTAKIYASSKIVSSLLGTDLSGNDLLPIFNDGRWLLKGKNTTRVYQNGQLIEGS